MSSVYRLLVCLVVNIISTAYGDCPDGFLVHKESCYKEFGIRATWAEASMICKVYGGYLANIDTDQEQLYVASYLARLGKDAFIPGKFWLGGSDIQTEGIWVWTHGNDQFVFTNWQSGEPSNSQGIENCVEFEFSTNFKWNDNDCQDRLNFLCEIPSNQPQIIG
ncbi:perlucin-like [Mytilus edulis]|uniref:perlucin-like n=1 Tax=Mytilus edulis TaxID=6550 RepID=UPI0039EEB5C6